MMKYNYFTCMGWMRDCSLIPQKCIENLACIKYCASYWGYIVSALMETKRKIIQMIDIN